MTRRNAIPKVPPGDSERQRFDAAVKERLQLFSGEIGSKLSKLDTSTATASDCAAKINELIILLQSA